jgi:hypothetical protein
MAPRSVLSVCDREVKQLSHRSFIGRSTKNLLSRARPCFGRHVEPVVPAAFAFVRIYQSALGPRSGLGPFAPAMETLID